VAKGDISRRHRLTATVSDHQQLPVVVSNRQSSSFVVVHYPLPHAHRRHTTAVTQSHSRRHATGAHPQWRRTAAVILRTAAVTDPYPPPFSLVQDNPDSFRIVIIMVRSRRAALLRVTTTAFAATE